MIKKYILFLWLAAVICFGLLYPIPFIPALGDRARILYFHVPISWVTFVSFMTAFVYGIKFLRTKDILYDYKAAAAAGIGLMFCVLATVTGSLWAKFNWGSFWNWDPRETSIFLLLLIYGAYFALRSATESEESRARLSSVYVVLAGITTPFFIFVLPRIIVSLHPDPIINVEGKIHMDTAMLIIFLCSLAGFTALFAWMLNLRIRLFKLELKKEN